jgi:ActR/RegA family two-component response regulator
VIQEPPNPAPSADEGPSLAVRCVRALMERHGLPKYRQSPWLADALGLSYSQAHRKMSGASPWTLEDLERVGALFGETLAQVVGVDAAPGSVAASLKLGPTSVGCRIWLGEIVKSPRPDSLVAVSTGTGWTALLAAEANDATAYRIERLEAVPSTSVRKVIAVLDDDQDLTHSICAHLEGSGYDARPFFRTADLVSSSKIQRYDGFVIDWIVGETSTLKLIAGLRAEDALCPIVVLTAQVTSGVVDEADIAEAVRMHHIEFSEKPLRMSILSASLGRAFATIENR